MVPKVLSSSICSRSADKSFHPPEALLVFPVSRGESFFCCQAFMKSDSTGTKTYQKEFIIVPKVYYWYFDVTKKLFRCKSMVLKSAL